ncbi:MAG TPA: DUF1732 domain-containing protein, partial [Polyangiales bacterium]|nr:DUF1732 domain-containing protein [Polyangiales bacterium]
LADESALLEDLVRKHAVRGRVDVAARVEGAVAGQLVLDAERARSAYRALASLRDELAPGEAVPLTLLSAVPSLFRESGGPAAEERELAVRAAANAACQAFTQMRRTEGAALARDLGERNARVAAFLSTVEPELGTMVLSRREKLQGRIQRLLEGTGVALDAARLEVEVALLADRADVSEEVTRLRSHTAQLAELLATPSDEPSGRRIEFLLQEMSREANTTGAKLPDAALTHSILELKAELERMREQVQNVL